MDPKINLDKQEQVIDRQLSFRLLLQFLPILDMLPHILFGTLPLT